MKAFPLHHCQQDSLIILSSLRSPPAPSRPGEAIELLEEESPLKKLRPSDDSSKKAKINMVNVGGEDLYHVDEEPPPVAEEVDEGEWDDEEDQSDLEEVNGISEEEEAREGEGAFSQATDCGAAAALGSVNNLAVCASTAQVKVECADKVGDMSIHVHDAPNQPKFCLNQTIESDRGKC